MRPSVSSCLETEIAENVGWSGGHFSVNELVNLWSSKRETTYVQKIMPSPTPKYMSAKQVLALSSPIPMRPRAPGKNNDCLAESSLALSVFFFSSSSGSR